MRLHRPKFSTSSFRDATSPSWTTRQPSRLIKVRDLFRKHRAALRFSPLCPLDLNLIEMAFANPKILLRAAAKTTMAGLLDRIGEILKAFTKPDLRVSLQHATGLDCIDAFANQIADEVVLTVPPSIARHPAKRRRALHIRPAIRCGIPARMPTLFSCLRFYKPASALSLIAPARMKA